MYDHFKILHNADFLEEDQLQQLFHSWDTNAIKGFNKSITKFLQKDQTSCKTIANSVEAPHDVPVQYWLKEHI